MERLANFMALVAAALYRDLYNRAVTDTCKRRMKTKEESLLWFYETYRDYHGLS